MDWPAFVMNKINIFLFFYNNLYSFSLKVILIILTNQRQATIVAKIIFKV